MSKSKGTFSQLELVRRDFLKALAAAGAAVAVAPTIGAGPAAAANPVVRGYGVTTAQLKDWSIMSKAIGIDMEFTGTNNSVGVFLRDVVAAPLGARVDLFIIE